MQILLGKPLKYITYTTSTMKHAENLETYEHL